MHGEEEDWEPLPDGGYICPGGYEWDSERGYSMSTYCERCEQASLYYNSGADAVWTCGECGRRFMYGDGGQVELDDEEPPAALPPALPPALSDDEEKSDDEDPDDAGSFLRCAHGRSAPAA